MTNMIAEADNISDVQRQILTFIKQHGKATNGDIARHLGVSYEAVRQQLRQLEAADLVVAQKAQPKGGRAGRPTSVYTLSPIGDHLFPKAYDDMLVDLIDTVSTTLGPEALREVLATYTDEKVQRWTGQLQDKSLAERLETLKGFYLDDDPYMAADEAEPDGDLRLVERNCPFLNVSTRRPAVCSVTVSTLSRLLGHEVTRDQKFQNGDGRCVFHVHLDRPVDEDEFRFAFEEEMGDSKM